MELAAVAVLLLVLASKGASGAAAPKPKPTVGGVTGGVKDLAAELEKQKALSDVKRKQEEKAILDLALEGAGVLVGLGAGAAGLSAGATAGAGALVVAVAGYGALVTQSPWGALAGLAPTYGAQAATGVRVGIELDKLLGGVRDETAVVGGVGGGVVGGLLAYAGGAAAACAAVYTAAAYAIVSVVGDVNELEHGRTGGGARDFRLDIKRWLNKGVVFEGKWFALTESEAWELVAYYNREKYRRWMISGPRGSGVDSAWHARFAVERGKFWAELIPGDTEGAVMLPSAKLEGWEIYSASGLADVEAGVRESMAAGQSAEQARATTDWANRRRYWEWMTREAWGLFMGAEGHARHGEERGKFGGSVVNGGDGKIRFADRVWDFRVNEGQTAV